MTAEIQQSVLEPLVALLLPERGVGGHSSSNGCSLQGMEHLLLCIAQLAASSLLLLLVHASCAPLSPTVMPLSDWLDGDTRTLMGDGGVGRFHVLSDEVLDVFTEHKPFMLLAVSNDDVAGNPLLLEVALLLTARSAHHASKIAEITIMLPY